MDLNGQTVLVTGASGFVASNILRAGLDRFPEARWTALVRPGTDLWRLSDLLDHPRLRLVTADLTETDHLAAVLEETRPDTILHCATYGMLLDRQRDIPRMVLTNVTALVGLVLAAADAGVQRFVNTGTTSEYGPKPEPMREDMPLAPNTVYGASKAAGTLLASRVAAERGLPFVTLRLFSPYGPWEHPGRFIPSLLLSALGLRPPTFASPSAVRDFTYIGDVVEAYFLAARSDRPGDGEVINIGTGRQHSLAEAVALTERLVGRSLNAVWNSVARKQEEPAVWCADNTRAADLLGWRPSHGLAEGLSATLSWMRDHHHLYTKE